MPFSAGGWLVSGLPPQSLRIEVPSSNHNYGILCVINSVSRETVQRVTILQSNGMVKRFHRQLNTAIMAHDSPNPWTATLPAVLLLLGIRSAVKETLGRSDAEMIYGMTLRLPSDFNENYIVDTDLENYSDKLCVAMSRLQLSPPCDTHQKTCSNIRSSKHVHMYFCDASR